MPVDIEHTFTSRGEDEYPVSVPPLPRLSPLLEAGEKNDRYEVVVVGAGPAGMMLSSLLQRYGLRDQSLLCIDAKDGSLKAGHADGIQPRTIEVFKSLGLADEILNEGAQFWEHAFWNTSPGQEDIIQQTAILPTIATDNTTRYPFGVCLHQGRIERMLERMLLRYSKRGVVRNTRLVSVTIDPESDRDYPVKGEIETKGQHQTVRCKHLVGADGARSAVRRSLGLRLEGESLGYTWGVMDLVVDTDFPDIRRACYIHSSQGSALIVPREKVEAGEHMTRIYVQLPGKHDLNNDLETARARQSTITIDDILKLANAALRPFKVRPKTGTEVHWWAVYQIGQRMLKNFTVKDKNGINRVFFVGDACHTHSPKAGQGMNVSMMDSYNLAWKLIYSIHGLAPEHSSTSLLDTYHTERHLIAQQLLELDRMLSLQFSGKVAAQRDASANTYTHEDILSTFASCGDFTSGCDVEYPQSTVVERTPSAQNPIQSLEYTSGILHPGRRLMNVRVKRHVDGNPRDLQDDFPSTGRFRVLVLSSTDLLNPNGTSVKALVEISSVLLPSFPVSVMEMVVLYPQLTRKFTWKDLPAVVKQESEMRFFNGSDVSDAYGIFGVDPAEGALAVLRPDGYVGVVAKLRDIHRIERYLAQFLTRLTHRDINTIPDGFGHLS